jgi:NitT/TauT family transport system substrate-binding protein
MPDRVVVGIISNAYGGWPLHIGKEIGFFKAADLAVEIQVTGSSVQHLKLLEEGKLNVGHQAADHIIRAVQQGSELRIIMGVSRPALSLVVRPNVKTIEELRDKRIGVDGASTGFALLLKEILRRGNLGQSDYSLIPIGSSPKRYQSLVAGEIEGTLLDPPYDLDALNLGYSTLARTMDYFPNLQGSVLAAKSGWAKENAEPLTKFLRAYIESLKWLRKVDNRHEAAKILAETINTDIESALRTYDEYVTRRLVFLESGKIDPQALEGVAKLMPDASDSFSTAACIESRYLEEALRELR